MGLGDLLKTGVLLVGLLTIGYIGGVMFLEFPADSAAPGGNGEPSTPPATGDVSLGDSTVSQTPSATRTDLNTPYSLNQSKIERLIHQQVNERRQANGVRELMFDDNLRAIARKHSRDMAVNGYVGHEEPDGDTREDRYEASNYDCKRETSEGVVTGGENIVKVQAFARVKTDEGMMYADSEEDVARLVVDAWLSSQGHRRTLLRQYWGREGIGVWLVHGSDSSAVYVTQNFC